MITMGISTNTRLISIAILSNNILVAYFTHLHRLPWSPVKRDRIIASLEPCVREYCIKSVALSIPYAHYQTPEHCDLVEAIKSFFASLRIPVYIKTPLALAAFSKETEKKRKKALMESMITRFPELTRYYKRELRNKNRYYHKLFEAVAAAVLVSKETE